MLNHASNPDIQLNNLSGQDQCTESLSPRYAKIIGHGVLAIALTTGAGTLAGTAYGTLEPEVAFAHSTGGYPDYNAKDCSGQFGQYSWCIDENSNGSFSVVEQYSSRGYAYNNCTDWVAFRIPEMIGKPIPVGWGNAKTWDNSAQNAGYEVDNTPEIGDIAVWEGTYGHVAVVESVNSDGSVNISEYNRNGRGQYGTRNNVTGVDHFIDLNGRNQVTNSSDFVTHPASIERGNGMEVFYKDVSGNLINTGWEPGEGWTDPRVIADGAKGNPEAVARGVNNMDIFFVDNDGNLRNVGWNNLKGWGEAAIRATGVVGDPMVIARNSSSMDVFYRDESNNLMNIGWNAGNGWSGARLLAEGELRGNPSVATRGWNNMDVFYRDQNNSLRNVGWNSSDGWGEPSTKVSRQLAGDPVVISRGANQMEVFYRDRSNNLDNIAWRAGRGWGMVNTHSYGDVLSDPAAISRSVNSMEVAYRSQSNALKTIGWNAGIGWEDVQIRAYGIYGEPDMLARSVHDMNVFFKANHRLEDAGWNVNQGWRVTAIAGTGGIG